MEEDRLVEFKVHAWGVKDYGLTNCRCPRRCLLVKE